MKQRHDLRDDLSNSDLNRNLHGFHRLDSPGLAPPAVCCNKIRRFVAVRSHSSELTVPLPGKVAGGRAQRAAREGINHPVLWPGIYSGVSGASWIQNIRLRPSLCT